MPPSEPRSALPPGWESSDPSEDDVDDLVALLRRHEQAARGWAGTERAGVAVEVAGRGAGTRSHRLVRDADARVRGWVSCHDRAAGRVLVAVTVDPELAEPVAGAVGSFCFAKAEALARDIAVQRDLRTTQLDSGAFSEDRRQQRWLEAAGFTKVRDWWQMSRPVAAGEAGERPGPRKGVVVRQVRRDDQDGMPLEEDLRDVHLVLEESFADHFNSHREGFEEFVDRLREDPGHRWDHWWLASVDGEPAGALVASAVSGHLDQQDRPGPEGSYVDYIGVHRRARGRGVAKALLHAVIADAAARGRDRVGLEVDGDSPTGADGLYASLGWQTDYVTQSWHKDTVATRAEH